ncbi:MAG: hypothetical protein QOJ99_6017 [Bryobacterales bacterium]|nr:hypothetical protein [Bryobacterales bacterium]
MLLLPLALGPFLANWTLALPVVESRRSQAYEKMAGALISGKSIWLNADLRPLKAAFIRQMPSRRSVLVLGSSRAATIASDWFPAGDAWNSAIPGGGIDDAAALFQVCVEAQRIPGTVILELFPGLMREPETGGSREYGGYWDRALNRYGMQRPKRLSQPASFSRSAMFSGLQAAFGIFFWKSGEQRPYGIQVLPDGRLSSAAIVSLDLAVMPPRELEWRLQSRPDQFASILFRRFLEDLQSRGIRVVVFLAPVNPLVWEFFSKRGGYRESWIRNELGPRGIQIAGSYSPLPFNAKPTDFLDAVHPGPALVRRILADSNVIASPITTTRMPRD